MRPRTASARAKTATGATIDLAALRDRLAEAEETLDAIRAGDLDALLVQGPGGPEVAFTGTGTDILDRTRHAEMAAQVARLRAGLLGDALDLVPSFAYMKDVEGRYTYANQPTLTLFGVSAEELAGSDDTRFFPPETAALLRAIDRRVLVGGEPATEEIDVRGPDGKRHVYLGVKIPLREGGRDGRIVGLLGISTDITERKLVEEVATAGEERYRSTLDSMTEGVAILDRDWRWLFINRVAEAQLDLLGHPAVVGQTLLETNPRIVETELFADYRRVMTEREPRWRDVSAPDRDGTTRWMSFSIQPVVEGILVLSVDITDRMTFERALRASEARLRGSIDVMRDAFVVCTAIRDEAGLLVDLRVDFANAAAGMSMGMSSDALVGNLLPAAMPTFDGLQFRDIAREVVETGVPWDADVVHVHFRSRDGRDVTGKLSLHVAKHEDGFMATWRDVTEREADRADRERLAIAVEQMAEAVVISDPEATILYVNPAFERVSGYSSAEVVGQNSRILHSGVQAPEFYREMWSHLAVGEVWTGEMVNRAKPGTLFVEEVTISPITDGHGDRTAYVAVKRDVTAERDARAGHDLGQHVRDALFVVLQDRSPDPSVEHVAQSICNEVVRVPGIDFCAVVELLDAGRIGALAISAPAGFPDVSADLSPFSNSIHERSIGGPWASAWQPSSSGGGWEHGLTLIGLQAAAYGPIVHGDHVDGVLMIGTTDPRFAATLQARGPLMDGFVNTPSALLAAGLHERRSRHDMRESIGEDIARSAFHPVFQPIVDLASRETVGYEALTRFDSGHRPDHRFVAAWNVGLGPDLELRTLEAAVAESRRLPAGRWLNLNISPRLLQAPRNLRELLAGVGRPIVLEVTEHDPIDDYAALTASVRSLGRDIRLAVDDAGAGVANFSHIVELKADFVKLDLGLVRGVNADLGRQALVIAMHHFSRSTGCRLIAEGIETEEEAGTLLRLGVGFGQGYLLGRPQPVDALESLGEAPATHPATPGPGGREGLGA